MAIWWQFGIFFPVLVYCVKRNLATLEARESFLLRDGFCRLGWFMSFSLNHFTQMKMSLEVNRGTVVYAHTYE
jgi:hypothetical protein